MDKKRRIQTDSSQREINAPLDGGFPVEVRNERLSTFYHGYFDCHWHPEFEFAVITDGIVEYQLNEERIQVKGQDGLLINSNTLHRASQIDEEDCGFCVIRVDLSLLAGGRESRIREKYMDPLMECGNLPYVYLSAKNIWQRRILDLLAEIAHLDLNRELGYELEIVSILCKIFQILYKECGQLIKSPPAHSMDMERIRRALSFIEANYSNKIDLCLIAGSIPISKGECCRVFRKVLRQSPMEYLGDYRIRRSLPLLSVKSLSMTEIAQLTGFSSSSYFAEIFRQRVGMTPSAYRRYVQSQQDRKEDKNGCSRIIDKG